MSNRAVGANRALITDKSEAIIVCEFHHGARPPPSKLLRHLAGEPNWLAGMDSRRRGEAAGFDAYLVKPVELSALQRALVADRAAAH